jgi:hypothetical protein
MNRGKGFSKTPVAKLWKALEAAARAGKPTRPRTRLRRRRDDAETRAADAAYRATCADLARICRGRCENPLCPGEHHVSEPLDANHVRKRWRYGRKTQAQRDDRSNLTMLRRGCHEWSDESIAGYRGRLSIIPWGNERFEFVVTRLRGGEEIAERAIYTRAKENRL